MFWKLLKTRDQSIYPSDAYGDELYRLHPDPDRLPATLRIWFDVYFGREEDADLFAQDCHQRRYEINRDHDTDQGVDEKTGKPLGAWNVDATFDVRPNHRIVRAIVTEMQDRVASLNGIIATWMLLDEETSDD